MKHIQIKEVIQDGPNILMVLYAVDVRIKIGINSYLNIDH